MSSQHIFLLSVGRPGFPRWMVIHDPKKKYWRNGTWTKLRRNGELWDSKTEAETELAVARASS